MLATLLHSSLHKPTIVSHLYRSSRKSFTCQDTERFFSSSSPFTLKRISANIVYSKICNNWRLECFTLILLFCMCVRAHVYKLLKKILFSRKLSNEEWLIFTTRFGTHTLYSIYKMASDISRYWIKTTIMIVRHILLCTKQFSFFYTRKHNFHFSCLLRNIYV